MMAITFIYFYQLLRQKKLHEYMLDGLFFQTRWDYQSNQVPVGISLHVSCSRRRIYVPKRGPCGRIVFNLREETPIKPPHHHRVASTLYMIEPQGLLQECDFQEDPVPFLGKLPDESTVCSPATAPHASILYRSSHKHHVPILSSLCLVLYSKFWRLANSWSWLITSCLLQQRVRLLKNSSAFFALPQLARIEKLNMAPWVSLMFEGRGKSNDDQDVVVVVVVVFLLLLLRWLTLMMTTTKTLNDPLCHFENKFHGLR